MVEKRPSPADREAAARVLGLVDDPLAHGKHKPTNRGRVHCGTRQYKDGFAPCQLTSAQWVLVGNKAYRGVGIEGKL